MTSGEAKLRILAEWRTWIGHLTETRHATENDALAFFADIERDYPALLAFPSGDDKAELVTHWLKSADLIKD